MWFSGGAKAISNDLQDWIVMAGDKGCLEHDVSQLAPSSSNDALAAHGAAVMCDWSQTHERGGVSLMLIVALVR